MGFVTFPFHGPHPYWRTIQHDGSFVYCSKRFVFLSPAHFSVLDNAGINVEHFLDVCMMCSLKVSLLSMKIPRYLMLLTRFRGCLFKYTETVIFFSSLPPG